MRLSLAPAIFVVTAVSADAAPQASSEKAPELDQVVQMVTISGECTKLIHAGQAVSGCKNILVNMNYSTGVSAFWFMTEGTIVSFSGDGSRRIEQGSETVVQSVDRIIQAATNHTQDDAEENAAVGFCRFSDPTKKGALLKCVAHTQAGLSEGTFIADGLPPRFEEFPVTSR